MTEKLADHLAYPPRALRAERAAAYLSNGDIGYTTHGLRKNAGIMLALNGASVPVIMACLGHKTEKMALYYTRLAMQGELADQGAEIMDRVFAEQQEQRKAQVRAQIKLVDK